MHGIGGALANEAAVDVHDGEHDVLLMYTRVCTVCTVMCTVMCRVCTVHGDVHVFLHDDVHEQAKWCTGLRFFTLVRN